MRAGRGGSAAGWSGGTMRAAREISVAVWILAGLLLAAADEPRRCLLGFFQCKDHSDCVLYGHVCDGEKDCLDGSDERDCSSECTTGQFQCAHGRKCIERSEVCDGVAQCQDRSDEVGCIEGCEHQCGERCLPKSFICDGQTDCEDASDEAQCDDRPDKVPEVGATEPPPTPRPRRCPLGSRPCRDQTDCVLLSHVCDGENDCTDGSDEDECAKECKTGQFQCAHGRKCIERSEVCDGAAQCQDRSDEVGCIEGCEHQCGDRCLPKSFICDGQTDCEDASDEAQCGDGSCSSVEFRCRSGQCVVSSARCDGHSDCGDDSDEQNCSGWTDCGEGECVETAGQCGQYQWQCEIQKQCVPQSWHCDGTRDCTDGSDEEECEPESCPPHQFQCGSSECVDPSLLCNGDEDCADGSDEGGACSTEKCTDQSQCTQDCYNTPTGARCWCREGFRPVGGAGCVDVDECAEETAVCSQACVNSEGSFHCTCDLGFVLEADGRGCSATGETYLLAAVQSELLLLDLQTSSLDTLSTGTQPVLALDYDGLQRRVYWAEPEAVKWISLDEQNRGTLVQGVRVASLALDWVGRSLYWLDAVDGEVGAVGLLDSQPVVIMELDVEEPLALTLMPQKGLMFWSEAGDEARIERAGMDGSDRRVLVSESLSWPLGLAVDPMLERLYWTDEKLRCIGSATLDGDDVKILQLVGSPHPFSLSVLGDLVYWSDSKKGTVQRAHKLTSKQHEVLLSRPGHPLHLKVMQQVMQPSVENPCGSMRCSHLCVLAPGLKGVCRCPSALRLGEDGLTCYEAKDSTFLLLLSSTAVTQVSLQSRFGAVGLQDWPEHQRVKLPGVNDLKMLDLVVPDQALYVWDAGKAIMGQFRVKDTVASWRGTLFTLLKNTLCAMAVDWVTLNLYWSNNGQPGLRVTSPKGSQTGVILQDEVQNISSITLHPPAGRMCFTNGVQTGKTPLECSYMDGQNRVTVWTSAVHPVSLSLSTEGDRLYWADTGLGVVSSVGVDGSGYKEMRTEEGLVSFALAGEVLVWLTRRDSTKCWFSDAQQGATLWFDVKADVVDVKAFSKQSQRGVNSCSTGNGGCAQLCLASPGGRTCVCGCGYLSDGELDCVPDPHCPPGTRPCLVGGECLPEKKFCDGRPDCADHSDEICTQDEVTGAKTNVSTYPSVTSPTVKPRTFGDPVLVRNPESDRNISHRAEPPEVLDGVVKVGGVDAESCGMRMCGGNGKCVEQDGGTVCHCAAGYSGPRCEDGLGGVIQGPVVYAAGGLCLAVIVLGATIGIMQKRKAANRRLAGARETQMKDLEKTVESTPSQQNSRDPEHTEEVASSAD